MDRYRAAEGTMPAWGDPSDSAAFPGTKEEARDATRRLRKRLADLQSRLYAGGRHKVLVVLQAMDTGGKDGTIRRVFRGVNPQGVRVTGFKAPTPEELGHDYLWRVHRNTPRNGEIAVFNRSHYEDVLVVRVHELVASERWAKRYDQINDFERMLADEGTTILKFFLNISRAEQKRRLQARVDDPRAHWKFRIRDLTERALWDEYMEAYRDAIERTSTAWAPWYVIPADRKWYRDLVVSTVVVEALDDLGLEYPPSDEDLGSVFIPD